jgi:hypothetical protein
MIAQKLLANSDKSLSEMLSTLCDLWNRYHYLRVSVVPGVGRSIDQNSMFFELYTHIADWFYGGDVELARAECKLDFGLQILRRDDSSLNYLCARTLDLMSREEQLNFIQHMSVTSEMSRGQASDCISAIMDTFSARGLMWPDYLTKSNRQLQREAA